MNEEAKFSLKIDVAEKVTPLSPKTSTRSRDVTITILDIDLDSPDGTLLQARRIAQRIGRMFDDMPTPARVVIEGKGVSR